jgi:CHRD domain
MHLKSTLTALLVSTLLIVSSCGKEDTDPPIPTVIFTAFLSGAGESTPNPSKATGTALFTYDKNTKILTGEVNFTGLTPIAGHIHKAPPGVAGPVIFPFAAPLNSPIKYTSSPLTEAQEADLFAGLNYVNLHTPALLNGVIGYPGGEIRGQLIKR